MKQFRQIIIVSILLISLTPGILSAATRNWTGATSNDWMDASNWSGGVLPATGDIVIFDNTSPATPLRRYLINVPAINLNQLLFQTTGPPIDYVLDSPSAVTITLSGTGSAFQVQYPGSVAISTNVSISCITDACTIEISGYVRFFALFTMDDKAHSLSVSATGNFYLKNGWTFANSNTVTVDGQLHLAGTLSRTQTGTTTINGSGTVIIDNGTTMTFGGGGGGGRILVINTSASPAMTNEGTLILDGTSGPRTLNISGANGLSCEYLSKTTIGVGTDMVITSMTLNSSSLGYASFINRGTLAGSPGIVNIKRFFDEKWHYFTPPTSGATASAFLTPSLSDWLIKYDEPSAGWTYIIAPATLLTQGTGYAAWVEPGNPNPIVFYGPPAALWSADFTLTGLSRTAHGTSAYDGMHLVGNAFTSAVDLSVASATWSNCTASAWFWNGFSENYEVWPGGAGGTHSPIAPALQGFFIQVTVNGSNTFSIPLSSRLHSTEAFIKEEIPDLLFIKASNNHNECSDLISVNLNQEATTGFDAGKGDGLKLWGAHNAPQLYTIIDNIPATCNALPFNDADLVIPVGFKNGMSGEMTLTASNLDSFNTGISIILEDLKTGKTWNLRVNPAYTFAYDTLDDPTRFVLRFSRPSGISKPSRENSIKVYTDGNSVVVYDLSGNPITGDLYVYDLLGKELSHSWLDGKLVEKIHLDVSEGYYIVKVVSGTNTLNKKVYLN